MKKPTLKVRKYRHTSPQMLNSTYRELVMPSEAERYWEILPPAEGAVIPFSARL